MKRKSLLALLSFLGIMSFSTIAYAEWNLGIGTGPQWLAVSGDVGINTVLGDVELDVDLDAKDIKDVTKSAIGLGGYVTDSNWFFQYAVGKLELEEKASRGVRTGATLTAKVNFDVTGAELTAGYFIYKIPALQLRAYTGARYTKHELDLSISGIGFFPGNRTRSISESWTDALIGLSVDVPFAEKWSWNIKTDAGFGGSEGTFLASTGLTWRFYGGWSATLFGKYVAVEYENGSKGDSDWYLYDVDESTLGLTILYNW